MTYSADAIRAAHARGDGALVGYLPVGYPTVKKSIQAAEVLFANGVDVLEFGFPYSDPSMDGPVIQQATTMALERGTHLEDLIEAVGTLAAQGHAVLSMTYWNPVYWFGVDKFAQAFAKAGGAGLITPDLPPEEAEEWLRASDKYDLERIFLVAPSSTDERLKMIAEACRGWTYATSTMGVTGQRADIDTAAKTTVERTRQAGAELVNVGLGVSNGAQAHEVTTYADGVIVGSALLKCLFDEDFDRGLETMAALARELRDGVKGTWKTAK